MDEDALSVERPHDRARLNQCLSALGRMVDEGRLAEGNPRTGVELEVALVDHRMEPATRNHAVLDRADSGVLTSELGSWNLEINLPPRTLPEAADGGLERDIRDTVAQADGSAREVGARAVTIGILPTLEARHLGSTMLTDESRYALLDERAGRARGEPFELDIVEPAGRGGEPVERVRMQLGSVAAEAACTSLQLHLQLAPDALAAHWNAAQAIAGVQVALAANSPFLLGQRLWAETRVPLFEQAVDTRTSRERDDGVRPRVWFGERWVSSAAELFAENVRHFDALLPLVDDEDDEDPLAHLDEGGVPVLSALDTHNSTVWRWNRPVYDVAEGEAHLRLENRVLPAGPTAVDSVADALFFYGLVRALTDRDLADRDRPVWRDMPFEVAQANFLAGARHGIDAVLAWPGREDVAVTELAAGTLLPLAEQGLAAWGVDGAVATRYLSVIEQRCRTRRTGATWQTGVVAGLERGGATRPSALRDMLGLYLEGMTANEPVHTWPQ